MTDTARTLAELQALLADNGSRRILAQHVRDALQSIAHPVASSGFEHGRAIGIGENVKDHGARGNGVDNDLPYIQAAYDSAAPGGRVIIPPGQYKCTGGVLNVSSSHVTFTGTSRESVQINFVGAGAGMQLGGAGAATPVNDITIEHLTLNASSGADLLKVVTGGIHDSLFFDLRLESTVNSPMLYLNDAGTSRVFIGNTFFHVNWDSNCTTTNPIYLVGYSNLNGNFWWDQIWQSNGILTVPWLFFDNTNTGGYNYQNVFRGVDVEAVTAGIAKVVSGAQFVFEDITLYDQPGPTTADLYQFAAHAGGLNTKFTRIVNCQRAGGALGGGLVDVNLTGTTYSHVEQSGTARGAANCQIIGMDVVNGFNPASMLLITQSGMLIGQLATVTKAGIPNDADYGAVDGLMVLDSTNHRLYIRDGGVWKYAALT